MNNGEKIREYLKSLPGTVEADNPSECLRRAWAACGIDCSVETFRACIAALGFTPDPVGKTYWLRFPGAAMKAPDNTAKLRNIVGRG